MALWPRTAVASCWGLAWAGVSDVMAYTVSVDHFLRSEVLRRRTFCIALAA